MSIHFPNDRLYTFGALVEELALAERHCRDESYKSCSCIPEKHLPLIAGLASEGYGFAESRQEKTFMQSLMEKARAFNEKISKGLITTEDCERLRTWAREARHKIESRKWREREVSEAEIENNLRNLTLPDMEDEAARGMVNYLSEKYDVPKPREILFVDACDPLKPNAAHMQRDEVKEGEVVRVRPDLDSLIFCRGGLTTFAVAHEFSHYLKHVKGETIADEGEANEFALKESRNNLYTGVAQTNSFIKVQENNVSGKGMAIDKKKGLTVFVGLSIAKLTDQYIGPQLDGMLGTMAQIGKIAGGGALVYLGLSGKVKGMAGDLLTFAGAELILTEAFKFLPTFGTTARATVMSGPIAVPMAPGRAVIRAATPHAATWQKPSMLTAGYPQIAQVDSKWIKVGV